MRAAGAESDRASFGRQKLTRVCVCVCMYVCMYVCVARQPTHTHCTAPNISGLYLARASRAKLVFLAWRWGVVSYD